jgi:hypothetical protein
VRALTRAFGGLYRRRNLMFGVVAIVIVIVGSIHGSDEGGARS